MRKTPYTAAGISRVPCLRCHAPSSQQWNICSLPGYHGICTDCDVALNELAVDFMRLPDAEAVKAAYRERMGA